MKKTLKELLILATVLIILNVTGLLGEVTGMVQRAVLFTGILNADIEEVEKPKKADYNLGLVSLDGQKSTLADHKGKVIFLNLWASWCGPCIAEMPNIQSLYAKVDKEDIVFVMISLDDTKEKAEKFINRKGLDFPVYMAPSGIPTIYRTGSIPTTHVISPDGKIVFSKKGTANYDTKSFRRFLEKQVVNK